MQARMEKARADAAKRRKIRHDGKEGPTPMTKGLVMASAAMTVVMLGSLVVMPGRKSALPDEPEILVVDGQPGAGGRSINGEYRLLPRLENDRPVWAKHTGTVRLPSAYVLFSKCGEWLISTHRTGRAAKCDGLVVAKGCGTEMGTGPWNCSGLWQSTGRTGLPAPTLAVTPSKGPAALSACSAQEEEAAQADLSHIDLVITWVNGSDSQWLAARAEKCEEFMWHQWPEALRTSQSSLDCLEEKESLEEAIAFFGKEGSCAPGAWGKEGACVGEASPPSRGLTTRASRCFRQLVDAACGRRERSIADHDELRYLIRSIERHMPWHQGRILLVAPRGHYPSWLQMLGRLRVLPQEDLFKAAMRAPEFVPAEARGERGYLPDGIFNDDPVLVALPFIPKVTRLVMVFQDDLFLPRPVGACDFSSRPPGLGLRLFGQPSANGSMPSDLWASIYRSHQARTSSFWSDWQKQQPSQSGGGGALPPTPCYEQQHAPALVDTALLRELWQRWPRELSATLDSPFRHPNLLDPIGLHIAEAVRRGREARWQAEWRMTRWETMRKKLSEVFVAWRRRARSKMKAHELAKQAHTDFSGLMLRSRVMDADDASQALVKEVVMTEGTGAEWKAIMKEVVNSKTVPAVLSIQDALRAPATADYICQRESWMNRLLPGESTFESIRQPPRLCQLAMQRLGTNASSSDDSPEVDTFAAGAGDAAAAGAGGGAAAAAEGGDGDGGEKRGEL